MRTDLELDWGDGRYIFRLTLEGIDELQRKTGKGLGENFADLLAGRYINPDATNPNAPFATFGMPIEAKWTRAAVMETIRLALVGGGSGMVDGKKAEVDPLRATQLMSLYCYPARPLKEAWDLATAILTAVVEGVEDDEHPVKKNSEKTTVNASDGSTTQERSPAPQSRASRPRKRPNSRSASSTP
jgi:hypothetical protein